MSESMYNRRLDEHGNLKPEWPTTSAYYSKLLVLTNVGWQVAAEKITDQGYINRIHGGLASLDPLAGINDILSNDGVYMFSIRAIERHRMGNLVIGMQENLKNGGLRLMVFAVDSNPECDRGVGLTASSFTRDEILSKHLGQVEISKVNFAVLMD